MIPNWHVHVGPRHFQNFAIFGTEFAQARARPGADAMSPRPSRAGKPRTRQEWLSQEEGEVVGRGLWRDVRQNDPSLRSFHDGVTAFPTQDYYACHVWVSATRRARARMMLSLVVRARLAATTDREEEEEDGGGEEEGEEVGGG